MAIKHFLKTTIVLSLLLSSTALFAQESMQKRTPEERAENQTGWMQKNLALTPDQHTKVSDINLHYAREGEKLMNAPRSKEKKNERQELMNDKDAELKMVLTGEQYQKYQAHVAEMKQKMQERRGMQQEGN